MATAGLHFSYSSTMVGKNGDDETVATATTATSSWSIESCSSRRITTKSNLKTASSDFVTDNKPEDAFPEDFPEDFPEETFSDVEFEEEPLFPEEKHGGKQPEKTRRGPTGETSSFDLDAAINKARQRAEEEEKTRKGKGTTCDPASFDLNATIHKARQRASQQEFCDKPDMLDVPSHDSSAVGRKRRPGCKRRSSTGDCGRSTKGQVSLLDMVEQENEKLSLHSSLHKGSSRSSVSGADDGPKKRNFRRTKSSGKEPLSSSDHPRRRAGVSRRHSTGPRRSTDNSSDNSSPPTSPTTGAAKRRNSLMDLVEKEISLMELVEAEVGRGTEQE